MFTKLFKGMRAKSENEKHKNAPQVIDPEDTATKGLKLHSRISIDDMILSRHPNLMFDMGKTVKNVTGVSRDEDRGNTTIRFYTNDDYFLQIEHYGSDLQKNVTASMIFHYLEDEYEEIDKDDEEQIHRWMEMIEDSEKISVQGHTYQRIDSNTFKGLEIVELEDEEINTIENYFNVFSRDVSPSITEYLIVNFEQEVEIDHDTGEITSYGDACGSMAIGTDLPLLRVSVQNIK